MSRTLQFDLITDSRFTKAPRKDLVLLSHNVFAAPKNLPTFTSIRNIRKLQFRTTVLGPANNSYRQRFYVSKEGKVTWDKIIEAVNKQGYSPYYQFV